MKIAEELYRCFVSLLIFVHYSDWQERSHNYLRKGNIAQEVTYIDIAKRKIESVNPFGSRNFSIWKLKSF